MVVEHHSNPFQPHALDLHRLWSAGKWTVFVVRSIGWSDVGSWDAVYDVAGKDTQANTVHGKPIALSTIR